MASGNVKESDSIKSCTLLFLNSNFNLFFPGFVQIGSLLPKRHRWKHKLLEWDDNHISGLQHVFSRIFEVNGRLDPTQQLLKTCGSRIDLFSRGLITETLKQTSLCTVQVSILREKNQHLLIHPHCPCAKDLALNWDCCDCTIQMEPLRHCNSCQTGHSGCLEIMFCHCNLSERTCM